MVDVPGKIAVTSPVNVSIVAAAILPLVHVPEASEEDSVPVLPTQYTTGPDSVPDAADTVKV